jgi:UDP-GlcNAc:undecaprenyl-phosphate GlcNAc-1-phosphate transferase
VIEGLLAPVAFAVAAASIPVFRRAAERHRLVDAAGDDPLKIHAAPVPFVGGLGIALGCAAALGLAAVTEPMLATAIGTVLAVGVGVAALGFRDDVATIPPVVRLAVELLAGGLAATLFDAAGFPFGAAAFAVFAAVYVVGAINAVNMLDGLDGLAGGVVLVSCAGFAVVGDRFVAAVALALAGALVGFLVYNFNPASVFMGDNGSYLLGFLVATMALAVTVADGTWRGLLAGVLLVGAPVLDAAFAIVRRLARGVSPFEGDRSHFYDLLVQRGMSTRAIALTSYAIQAALVAAGVALLVL